MRRPARGVLCPPAVGSAAAFSASVRVGGRHAGQRAHSAHARRKPGDVLVHTGSVGKLPHGGVSERPKEHASKACDG